MNVIKVIALVDGEHYPAVTRWGLASAVASGYEVLAALLVGGMEKLDASRRLDLGATDVLTCDGDPMRALGAAIREHRPGAVLDLSDEPVLGYDRRMELVAVALANGVPYIGPDFRFEPPIVEAALPVPTYGVIGMAKRSGKTALAGHVARLAAARGLRPVIVAMGRGGPSGPVATRPEDVTLEALKARVERGEHAASDFLEDALMAGVPTVGARRCGGGMGGRPFVTNVAEAAALAVEGGAGFVILEGSGASVPTVPWDAGLVVIPSDTPAHHVTGYLGPLRILLSDLAVSIIGGGSTPGAGHLSNLESLVRRFRSDIRVAMGELQPVPLTEVRGKDAFFATTAHPDAALRMASHLERTTGCRVVKVSAALADRAALEEDLASAPAFDVLLTELKAAAVDVAAKRAAERGAEVVFVDNRPRSAGGDHDLDELIVETLDLAVTRASERMR